MVAAPDRFSQVTEFPDDIARDRYENLVGLDTIKARVIAEGRILLDRESVRNWSVRHHGRVLPIVEELGGRTPLLVFAGDVGTGKSELAETLGDAIAREMKAKIRLLSLNLTARGQGAVGQMTSLISGAFEEVAAQGRRAKQAAGRSAVVLLIDEADALAQSRDMDQMHHEDRAGVNALLRGIDSLRQDSLPVLVIVCTNRLEALDPALRRRAAGIHLFARPDADQRRELLGRILEGLPISTADVARLAEISGPNQQRRYGWTFSDIRQRFLSDLILTAYPDTPIDGRTALDVAERFVPTTPFGGQV